MANPEDVNPEKFKVDKVLYNFDDFSISYGTWTPDSSKKVAMRWNDGYDGSGYPKVFGHPQWFIISEHLSKVLLSGLQNSGNINTIQYNDILETLKDL